MPSTPDSPAASEDQREYTQIAVDELETLLAATSRQRMRGLTAWFVVGLASVGAYMWLALDGRPIWDSLPFLALMAGSIFICGTAGVRRGR